MPSAFKAAGSQLSSLNLLVLRLLLSSAENVRQRTTTKGHLAFLALLVALCLSSCLQGDLPPTTVSGEERFIELPWLGLQSSHTDDSLNTNSLLPFCVFGVCSFCWECLSCSGIIVNTQPTHLFWHCAWSVRYDFCCREPCIILYQGSLYIQIQFFTHWTSIYLSVPPILQAVSGSTTSYSFWITGTWYILSIL